MDKKEEKEIDYLNSHINRLWTSLIVLIGGLAGILLSFSGSEPTYKKVYMIKFTFVEIFPIVMTIVIGIIGFWGVYEFNKNQPKEEKK